MESKRQARFELLFELKPGDRDRTLAHSLSSYPGKWLDTFPVVPRLLLDDQALPGNHRIRHGVGIFTTLSYARVGSSLMATMRRMPRVAGD
jgi:hypothetical protein